MDSIFDACKDVRERDGLRQLKNTFLYEIIKNFGKNKSYTFAMSCPIDVHCKYNTDNVCL